MDSDETIKSSITKQEMAQLWDVRNFPQVKLGLGLQVGPVERVVISVTLTLYSVFSPTTTTRMICNQLVLFVINFCYL